MSIFPRRTIANPFGCRYTKGANQNTTINISTPVTFDTLDYDDGNFLAGGLGTSSFTIPVNGRYMVIGQIEWVSGSTGLRTLRVSHSVMGFVGQNEVAPNAQNLTPIFQVSAIFNATAGQTVSLHGLQNVATPTAIIGSVANTTWIAIEKLGGL